MRAAGDETGEMRHVDHEISAAAVRNCAEPGEVDDPRIGAAARDYQFRPVRLGLALDFVVIDARVIAMHPVAHRPEPFPREVRRGAMGQMAAGGKKKNTE